MSQLLEAIAGLANACEPLPGIVTGGQPSAEHLAALAARVGSVYGYFSNQFQGHAPASTRAMQKLIGQKPVEPEGLGAQTSLFRSL